MEFWVEVDVDEDETGPEAVAAAFLYFLGDTEFDSGVNGRLQRTPPLAHPLCPWMYAVRVESFKGYAKAEETSSVAELYDAPPPEGYAEYPAFVFKVRFQALPYDVLSDSKISTETVEWYDENGDSQSTTCPTEWQRWTDFEEDQASEIIQADFGQQVIRGTTLPGEEFRPFPGKVSMRLARSAIICTWYCVPYRFYASPNSLFRKYQHYINQVPFSVGKDQHGNDMLMPAGYLRLDSAKARRYLPPVPEVFSEGGAQLTVTSSQKLCDIVIRFEVAAREAEGEITPYNPNWIASGGHNLNPWVVDKLYYYTTTVGFDPNDEEEWVPAFFSVPFQLLFRDPDV
jgi:hypothetical protein